MVKYFIYSLLLFAGVLISCAKTDAQEVKHISVKEAHKLLQQDTGVFILDVRTEGEYVSETGHLTGAYLIPVDELEARIAEVPKTKKVLTYCRTGRRSAEAAKILSQKGISASTMDGGIVEWLASGFEVKRAAQ